MRRLIRRHLAKAALLPLLLASVVLSGCGGDEAPTPTPTPAPEPEDLALQPVLGSSDLAVGTNRLVFALLRPNRELVKAPTAQLSLYYLEGETAVAQSQAEAVFRRWPASPGGVFTAQVEFTRAGVWIVEIAPAGVDAEGEPTRLVFEVMEQSVTPALGVSVPPSHNRTAGDVTALDQLTTDPTPDPDLYEMTIAQALGADQPFVVTFATPAFCSSATCGPQVDVIKELKQALGERASFIHVEIYENPLEMQGDPSKGRVAQVVNEWGLVTEPWTFIVDAQGRLTAKFEGFASYEELEEALKRVLS